MAKKRALKRKLPDHEIKPYVVGLGLPDGFMLCNYPNTSKVVYCGVSMRWRSQPLIEDPFPTRTEAEIAWELHQQPKPAPPVPIDEDPILTISEAALKLGKHRNTIARWCEEGVIKAGKHPLGRFRGIRQSQVDRLLKMIPV